MPQEPTEIEIVPNPLSAIVGAAFRLVVASSPLACLGQGWSEYANYTTGKRIQALLRDVLSRLTRLEQRASDPDRGPLQCDDFPELLEITVEKVKREFDDAKRSRYAQVLARLIAERSERTHEQKVSLLESLDLLSETDLQVLQLFDGREAAQIRDLKWRELGLSEDLNDQLWEMSSSLARLESRGLILKISLPTTAGYVKAPLNVDTATWEMAKYRLLPLGESLIAVLFQQ